MNRILLLITIVVFALFQHAEAQKKIKLTNNQTQKVLILEQGMRVAYLLHTSFGARNGVIKTIDKSSVKVDDRSISYQELTAIGRRRRGSGAFQIFCGAIGGGAIGSSLVPAPTPQCTGCQVQSSNDTGATVAGVLAGVAIIGIGVNSIIRNTPKNVVTNWKLEVIE